MKKQFFILSILSFIFSMNTLAAAFTIEAESMTLSGYTSVISSPFSGIRLYGNGDKGTATHTFTEGDGNYKVSITGASSNSNTAGISLYVNNVKLKAFTFSGTTPATLEAAVKITGLTSSNTIVLLLETDTGANDTDIDKITFSYEGAIVVKDPPTLPATGAYFSNEYRNMFAEAGYTELEINQKLENLWNQFFYGNASTQALYYPVGTDEAYILDTGNNDVRSEGMSYGMMICVQMDKQTEFDRLWKWAKTRMQHQSGARKGYFAWQMNTGGSMMDQNPASDGEEYFIMALMFASGRWGDGSGIYNYWKEANDILDACLNKEPAVVESVKNLFNSAQKQVVFTPYANAADYTDPSYHLPAFYQLWSYWADANRSFFAGLAAKSREMFPKFAHATTGLMPDYANFDGTPTGGNHADFRFDAWRCIMNMAVDYAWFKADENEVALVNKIHNFFAGKGIDSYSNQYSLAGNSLSTDHSPGLSACNATGALASNQAVAWDFIDEFFNTAIPTGQYRYYDGLLYFMNFLHLSGNFRIYESESIKDPGEPADPEDPEDPGYTTPDGYFIIGDFESYELNQELYNASNVTATVKANPDPTTANEQSANVTIKNYSSYWKISVTLPKGKTLADYEKLLFDIYLPAGYDNSNKSAYAAINSTQLSPSPSGSMELGKWLTKECAIPVAVSSLNSFDLYLGFNTNNGFFYIDNVKLKGEPEAVKIEPPASNRNIFCYSGNMLYLGNTSIDNVSIFDISGNLLVSENNISSSLDISNLNSGVYIVRISVNAQVYNMKVLIV